MRGVDESSLFSHLFQCLIVPESVKQNNEPLKEIVSKMSERQKNKKNSSIRNYSPTIHTKMAMPNELSSSERIEISGQIQGKFKMAWQKFKIAIS